jgi:hypothetical protein
VLYHALIATLSSVGPTEAQSGVTAVRSVSAPTSPNDRNAIRVVRGDVAVIASA